MTVNSTLAPELYKLQQTSPYIELYTLNASNITGGAIYNLTNHPDNTGGGLIFAGTTYQPFPIITGGWEYNTGDGALARPTLTVSNANKTILNAIINLGDLVGAKLTRIRTYEKFLDTGSSPNSSAYIGPDVYYINQLTYMDNETITFELSNSLDRMGMLFPRRQILKDVSVKNLYAPGISRTRFR